MLLYDKLKIILKIYRVKQDLRQEIYTKSQFRFWGIYTRVLQKSVTTLQWILILT